MATTRRFWRSETLCIRGWQRRENSGRVVSRERVGLRRPRREPVEESRDVADAEVDEQSLDLGGGVRLERPAEVHLHAETTSDIKTLADVLVGCNILTPNDEKERWGGRRVKQSFVPVLTLRVLLRILRSWLQLPEKPLFLGMDISRPRV